ncbi:MAG: hypothetical protein HRT35_19985 [Algicola sp.]|nr:hypothetical protein [Algicola sp.]
MNELYELLENISRVLWFVYAMALLMFYYISKKYYGAKSSLITMIIILVSNTLMLGYQEVLVWYIEGSPGISSMVHFTWFMGFASFYLISLAVLYKVHKAENVKISTLGQFTGVSFLVSGCLQLAQYAEIVIFKTNVNMKAIYTIGIPTLNIAMAVVSFGLGLLAIYYLHFNKKGLEGLKRWTI